MNVSISRLIKIHEQSYERMLSRNLVFKLFEYKRDFSPAKKDVAALLLKFCDTKVYDTSYFCDDIISSFKYLNI